MSELIDLSYYKVLPQQFGTQPKILVNEITNDIEFYCCSEPSSAIIEYAFSKICEVCDIAHEKVYWGTDLHHSKNNIVTVTPFNLNKDWLYLSEDDKISLLNNKNHFDFSYLLSSMLGATLWGDDVFGYLEDNTFIKAFHHNSMFNIELAMFVSKGPALQLLFTSNLKEILNDFGKNEALELEYFINKFIKIKKHEWLDIFDFPQNAKFEKSKFWLLKKIGNVQKEFIYFLDK